ncbi:Dihydromonacolin L monooxygenase [Lecanosticta acicola]|uniref:Dihydromonacolin L monooxygenase n=1 Tax=Lecanosticta acicola TaxID=111012 RepID=A0AAI8YSQ4_9PEZI|nr:Dihydromonacolin L monooxygenase [Lecanosticta acicola]
MGSRMVLPVISRIVDVSTYTSTQLQSIGAISLILLLAAAYFWLPWKQPYPGIPVIKLREKGLSKWIRPLNLQMAFRVQELFALGRKTGKPFQVLSFSGWRIVLPHRFADEIRTNPNLTFNEILHVEFPTTLPGWEGISEGVRRDEFFTDLVHKITQCLAHITNDLIEETDWATRKWLSDEPDWQTYELRPMGFDIVARVSTRVFAGKKLSRNDAWIRIANEYGMTCVMAAAQIRMFPKFLWPLLNHIIPKCRSVQRQFREATELLLPSIEATRKWYEQDEAKKGPKTENAIGWMIEVQKGRPMGLKNFVGAQISLSTSALEMNFTLLGFCLIAIIEHPEVLAPLREEMISVLRAYGSIMNRYVRKPTTLSDGTLLPAGAMLLVLDDGAKNSAFYEEPEKFIADRYLRMRQKPGADKRHQFSTVSSDNLAFGLGTHACPGRFLVHDEMKTLLTFMLLRYDWRFEPGYIRPQVSYFEHIRIFPRDLLIQARRRTEEVDLLQPQAS